MVSSILYLGIAPFSPYLRMDCSAHNAGSNPGSPIIHVKDSRNSHITNFIMEDVMTRLSTVVLATMMFVVTAFSGIHKGPRVPASRAITGDEVRHALPARVIPSYPLAAPGDSITFTTYDYGTNGSVNRNIVNYGNGIVSFARMMAQTLDAVTPDRGSWYNYSTNGGRTWQFPWSGRIELARRGWTNIDQLRDFGGIEVVVSHTGAGLEVNVDADRGANSWLSSMPASTTALWPRLAIGSGLYIHIINAVGGNPPSALGYTRSTDGGLSFDRVDFNIFPANASFGADGYAAAARGNKVAFVTALEAEDVVLLTSTNNGDTWTTTTIYDVTDPPPTPQFQPDGSCDVLIDSAGVVHVAWSNYLNDAGTLYLSIDAPIMYWNSASQTIRNIAFPYPDTTMGTGPPGRDGNYASQPDLAANATGSTIYCVFSQGIPERDASNNPYEHVYAVASRDGGTTWGSAVDITPGSGFDAAFPSIPDFVQDTLYVSYLADALAGNFISNNHSQVRVAVMWLRVPVSVITSAAQPGGELPQTYSLKQNYPNPFNPSTTITFSLPKEEFVTLKVYNMLGQEIRTLVNEIRQAGEYGASFNAADLPSGVYLYKLSAGRYLDTKKMVLMK